MNGSSSNVTVVLQYRDTFTKAIIKNVIVVVIGISINYVNVGLIRTFRRHEIFHTNPRYILFCHLVFNDMILVTLTVLLFIISYTIFKIKASACCVFILLAIFTMENTPLNLACMALECYVAVCFPLRHAQICTVRRTQVLLGLIWITSFVSGLPDLFVTLATQPPDFFHSEVFCVRKTVFSNPHILQKRDATYIMYLVIVWITIVFTYLKILFTAKSASGDTKKARSTVLLHGLQVVLCMGVYIDPLVKRVLLQLFPRNASDTLFVCYIIVQVLPRSISPIIYGFRDKSFRKHLTAHLSCNTH